MKIFLFVKKQKHYLIETQYLIFLHYNTFTIVQPNDKSTVILKIYYYHQIRFKIKKCFSKYIKNWIFKRKLGKLKNI